MELRLVSPTRDTCVFPLGRYHGSRPEWNAVRQKEWRDNEQVLTHAQHGDRFEVWAQCDTPPGRVFAASMLTLTDWSLIALDETVAARVDVDGARDRV